MPRTVQEILDHAEVLVEQCENDDPRAEDEINVAALLRLRNATAERSLAERHMIEAIREARKRGVTWAVIGGIIGTSGEAVRQRYKDLAA